MPQIIPYETVLAVMTGRGFRCNYYNGGAFGFTGPAAADVRYVGWVGPEDPTLRPAAALAARQVPPPFEENLATLLARACGADGVLGDRGRAWVMPMSHWAFELDYGSRDWMPGALADVGIDPTALEGLTNAAAIEFDLPAEVEPLRRFVRSLLTNLQASDFMLAFTDHPVLCTLHHHKQLWWTTTDPGVLERLEGLARETP